MHIEQIKIGDKGSITKKISDKDVEKYAEATGDNNPIHMSDEYAANTIYGERIVQGMLVASIISSVIGTKFPGEGAIYISQSVKFLKPVFIGDIIIAEVEVMAIDIFKKRITLKTNCYRDNGIVVTGEAVVQVPDNN